MKKAYINPVSEINEIVGAREVSCAISNWSTDGGNTSIPIVDGNPPSTGYDPYGGDEE